MIEIRQIKAEEIEPAKQVITTVCLGIWQDITKEDLRQIDSLLDVEKVQSHYLNCRGEFLVVVDREQIVGTGAVRQLSASICELKRMWLLPAYQSKGLGRKMMQVLLNFARRHGYRVVKLDLYDRDKQSQALKFYQEQDFYPIKRYNNSPCKIFMEKLL